jgi:hypothetical protein
MGLKCIACDVMARPVYMAAALSPHTVDVSLEPFGLHMTPNKLRERLQSQIDAVDPARGYDAVVLAYGLCGKATDGLQAAQLPLVIPRAHDCITLFLGGKDRYTQEFERCPGTYWYVRDFVERSALDPIPLSIGAYTSGDADAMYAEFLAKYGEDNAQYLMEVLGNWQAHYERAAYILMDAEQGEDAADEARNDANAYGWRFEQLTGDLVLIKRLLWGDWGEEDFLVLQPGETIEMIGGDEIIRSAKS